MGKMSLEVSDGRNDLVMSLLPTWTTLRRINREAIVEVENIQGGGYKSLWRHGDARAGLLQRRR